MVTSARLVRACAERLATVGGPIEARLGKIIRVPEGQTYLGIEAPLGIAGVYLSSRGEKTPWRLKLRTPSFNNVASLETLLVGVVPAALEATLASVGYVVGDIDKKVAVRLKFFDARSPMPDLVTPTRAPRFVRKDDARASPTQLASRTTTCSFENRSDVITRHR